MSVLDNTRCTVLNSTYDPLNVVSARRALLMYLKGKAVIIESLPPESSATSERQLFPVPTQVLLKEYKKTRPMWRVEAFLTQRNLKLRDNYTCQYCGRTANELNKSKEFLTRDHIYPQDKGGPDTWTNVVLACSTCNNKKANYTLEQMGWKLKKTPHAPTRYELWKISNPNATIQPKFGTP